MPISEWDGDGRDDNEGPHCRNCHIGANNCYVCHSNEDITANFGTGTALTARNVSAAYTSNVATHAANVTPYASQTFVKQSAVSTTTVGKPCLDGGFSFPHRTLGENMLKDELFGIDFNGTAIAAGVTRTGNAMLPASTDPLANQNATTIEQVPLLENWIAEDRNATSHIPAVRTDNPALTGVAAENLDSVCIDCHGDSTYYNAGPGAWTAETYVGGDLDLGARGLYGTGEKGGWELLIKGLP